MHKAKKAVSNLKDYLGRDGSGLKLLEEVSKEVNNLRKQVAKEAGEADRSASEKDALRSKMEAARSEISDLRQRLDKAMAQLNQANTERDRLRTEVASLRPKVNDEPDPETDRSGGDPNIPAYLWNGKAIDHVCRMLTSQMRTCPSPVSARDPKRGRITVYDLADLVTDLSSPELLKLGRFVALIAVIGYPITVESVTAKEAGLVGPKAENGWSDKSLSRFVKWYRKNIDCSGPMVDERDPDATQAQRRPAPLLKGDRGITINKEDAVSSAIEFHEIANRIASKKDSD